MVERVTSLPLVSSTYSLVFSVYSTTKDHHPYFKTVCEAAEQGVCTITSVALTSASPIIIKLEPQSKSPELLLLPVLWSVCTKGLQDAIPHESWVKKTRQEVCHVWSFTQFHLGVWMFHCNSFFICVSFVTVAVANDLACKGLDKIEQTLPILQQPSEQVQRWAKLHNFDINTTCSVCLNLPLFASF